MAHIDLIATLLDELDDMEAELRLHNLRYLLGVGEVKGHRSEGRIEHTTTGETQLTTSTGSTRIFRIETGQRRERGIATIHTIGIFTELILHTVQLLDRDLWRHLNDLHLHLRGDKRQTVFRQILVITAYISRGDGDILNEFTLHPLHHLTVFQVLTQVTADLRQGLMTILLETFTGAVNHFEPVVDILFDL